VTAADRAVPAWALASALVAPIALIGGWTVAAGRQPGHYRPVRQTISALAAHGATDRWIMTAGLALLGAAHIVTALGLRPARVQGRWLLAAGGLSTLVVAAASQPVHGSAAVHVLAATIGFVALSLWPVAAGWPARTDGPPVLRWRTSLTATVVLLVLLAWLAVETQAHDLLGLSERALAGAEALWPLAVVILLRSRGAAAARMAA
jgi:uncharacterized protein DUF998